MTTATLPTLTKKDFQTDQEVRWCPGCGDYAILAAVQSVFPELGIPREKFVVVSGIGCSSRFPYYMNTFGFHRSEEHTSELQSHSELVCRLLLEKKKHKISRVCSCHASSSSIRSWMQSP